MTKFYNDRQMRANSAPPKDTKRKPPEPPAVKKKQPAPAKKGQSK